MYSTILVSLLALPLALTNPLPTPVADPVPIPNPVAQAISPSSTSGADKCYVRIEQFKSETSSAFVKSVARIVRNSNPPETLYGDQTFGEGRVVYFPQGRLPFDVNVNPRADGNQEDPDAVFFSYGEEYKETPLEYDVPWAKAAEDDLMYRIAWLDFDCPQ